MIRKRRDAYQPKGHFQQNLPIFLLKIMLNYNQMMLELVSDIDRGDLKKETLSTPTPLQACLLS